MPGPSIGPKLFWTGPKWFGTLPFIWTGQKLFGLDQEISSVQRSGPKYHI